MLLAHPHVLWLLVLSPLLGGLGLRAGIGGRRRWLVAALRAACVAAVVLALSRPMLRVRETARTEVLVVDLGPTMPDSAPAVALRRLAELKRQANVNARAVAFSNRAELVLDPSVLQDAAALGALRARINVPAAADDLPGGGSAVEGALQLAAAQIAPRGHGDIELISNGLQTRGDAEAEAYRLANRGIGVRVIPAAVSVRSPLPVLVRDVSLPASAKIGQTVPVDVTLEASAAGEARVRLVAEGRSITASTAITPGRRQVHLLLPLRTPGLLQVTATAALSDGPASASCAAAIDVGSAARVLLVQQAADETTAAALQKILGRSADIRTTTPDALDGMRTESFGSIVLADVPADALSTQTQERLRRGVLNGQGLLVTGAARAFGPGGYDQSLLAPALPVHMPQQMESIDPSTTLVLIIDTSGSMEDFRRIDLAKQVAHLAVSHLKPHDKVGIVEFYGGKRWAAPIQTAANSAVITRALSRLTAGGGTTLYPAIEEAAFALRGVNTQSKHVLILSDGGLEAAPFAPLLRQMAEDGIAVSTVAVAPTAGQPNLMPDIACWGGGRYYAVPDQYALPDITLKQPRLSLMSPLVQKPSKVVGSDDPLVPPQGVDAWPNLNGYVRTAAQPTADVLLRTADGDPLLARWRYGAGYVATLPTQLGSAMSAGLQDDAGFATLISGLFRQISSTDPDTLRVDPRVRPAGLEIDMTCPDDNPVADADQLEVALADPSGSVVRTAVAGRVSHGRWNVLVPGLRAGAYGIVAGIEGAPARGRGAIAVGGPRAVPALTADTPLLDRVSGFGALASDQAAHLPPSVETFVELRELLAAVAVLMLVLHVACRRPAERGR